MSKCRTKLAGIFCAALFAFTNVVTVLPVATARKVNAEEAAGKIIQLHADEGANLSSQTVTLKEDGTLPELPVPTREGYDFIGWYTQKVETKYWGDTNGDNWQKYKKHYTEGGYKYIDGKSIEWYNEGEQRGENGSESYNWKESRWIETSVGLASATKGQPAESGKALPEETETLYAMYDPKNITVYWYSNGWNNIDDCWAVTTGRSTGFEYGGKFAELPLDDWATWAGHEFKGWVDKDGKKIEFEKVTYERDDVYSYVLKDYYKPAKYEPVLRLYAIYDDVTSCGGSVETATVERIGGSGGYFDPNTETYTFTALFDSRYKDLSSAKWEITSGGDLFDLKVSKDKTSATITAKADKKDEIAKSDQGYRIDVRLTAGGKSVEAYATAAHDWNNGKILSGLWNRCESPMNVLYTCKKCNQTREREYEPDGHRYTYIEHPATCTENATRDRYCVVCGRTEHEILENTAKGHSYKISTLKGCGGTVVTSTCTTCGHVETQEDHVACHDWNSTYTVDKAATCTTEGSESIRCKNCNVVKESRVIPAKGHSYKDKTVKATCTEEGYTTHTCTKCGDSYTDAYVEATGHNYRETVERGCNGNEVTVKTCKNCGETETIGDRSALGHVWSEYHVDSEATCTKAGSKSITCTVCGEVKETKTIPATGHSYTEDVHAATCTEKGYVVKTCSACGDSYTEITADAKGHDWKIETQTGCGGAKVVTKTCKTCGVVEKTGDPSALDHVWGQSHVDREATCTTAGSKSVTCVKCGTVKERTEIPATGHSYRDEYHAPTCTENGYTVKICTKCNDRLTVPGEAAKGHNYNRTEVKATCTTDGTVSYRCTVCGDHYTEKGEDATGHSYEKSEVLPTCTTDGTVTYTCTTCGDHYTEAGKGATGHSYEKSEVLPTCTTDGTVSYRCTVCGDNYTEAGKEATGHSYEKSEVLPTCTTDGAVTYTCTTCKHSYTEKGEEATGHSYEKSELLPTCTTDGTVTYTCTTCKHSYTEKGKEATGHSYEKSEVLPTCTTDGTVTYTCAHCGDSFTEAGEKATGHTFIEEVHEATCTEDGYIVKTCACGEKLTVKGETAKGHNFSTERKEPTATEEGYILRTCDRCNEEEKEVLPVVPVAEPERTEAPEVIEPETKKEPEVQAEPEVIEPEAEEKSDVSEEPTVSQQKPLMPSGEAEMESEVKSEATKPEAKAPVLPEVEPEVSEETELAPETVEQTQKGIENQSSTLESPNGFRWTIGMTLLTIAGALLLCTGTTVAVVICKRRNK